MATAILEAPVIISGSASADEDDPGELQTPTAATGQLQPEASQQEAAAQQPQAPAQQPQAAGLHERNDIKEEQQSTPTEEKIFDQMVEVVAGEHSVMGNPLQSFMNRYSKEQPRRQEE